jgi:hypothetical protein
LLSWIHYFISNQATFHTRSNIVILFINTRFELVLHRDVECLLYDLFSNKPYALLCMIYCKCKKRCGYHFCFSVSWHCMCHWSSYHGSTSHNQRPNTEHPYHRNLYNCYGVSYKYDQIIYILSKFLHFVAWKLKFNQTKYVYLQHGMNKQTEYE